MNSPQKFLNPLKLVQIFKDFYLSFSGNNTDYNFDNFPIFLNNALIVTRIENQLQFSNNGKRFPCLIFNVVRRELPQIPIGLVYERLLSMNDTTAKQLADKILKFNDKLTNEPTKLISNQLTQEEENYKENYQQKVSNLLIKLDEQNKKFCVITHQQDSNGDLNMTRIILNKKLIELLTDEPENFIFDSINYGIPAFFGIKNIYELYLNVFKNLTGMLLKNYGVFFNSQELTQCMALQNCYGQIIQSKCILQNTFIFTQNYHERNFIRCFSPIDSNIKIQKPSQIVKRCLYKQIQKQ